MNYSGSNLANGLIGQDLFEVTIAFPGITGEPEAANTI
jgi:hypothetical protein